MMNETPIKFMKCSQCNQNSINQFSKHLPCGNQICSICMITNEKDSSKKQFKCVLCSKYHFVSGKESSLNQSVYNSNLHKSKKLLTSTEYEQMKANLNRIETQVTQVKLNYQNGAEKIEKHCAEQRKLVYLSTEKKIRELKIINKQLIKKIDDYEAKRIQYYMNKNESIKKLISKANEFLDENKEFLKQIQMGEDSLIEFNQTSKNLQLDLGKEQYIDNDLENKLVRFNPNLIELNESILGFTDQDRINSYSTEIFSGSVDNTIKLWNLDSKQCIKTFVGHNEPVLSVKQVPGNKIISGSSDTNIKIWDIETGECLKTISKHSGMVRSIKILSDSRFITCSSDKTIKLFDLNTGYCIQTYAGHSNAVNCIDKLTENKFVSCSDDKTVRVWNLESGVCLKVLKGHTNCVWCVKKNSDSRIISSSEDKTIKLWEYETGRCLKTLTGHLDSVNCILEILDDIIVSCSEDKTIKVWNLNSGECLKTIAAHSEAVFYMDKISKSKIISSSAEKFIKVWDIETGDCLQSLEVQENCVWSMEIFR